jgi:hypothetical protein
MGKIERTHFRRHDFRVKSLDMVVDGLQKSIAELEKKVSEIHWYDADWLMEETEPIYGLAFIAFQNYIIGSIADIEGTTKTKHDYYKKDQIIPGYTHTTIELITALANYAKHKDEGLLKGTIIILDGFRLNYKDVIYLNETAIFQGLDILDSDWDLIKIKDYLTDWRESLWTPASL